jgi:hypothetical protein
MGGEVSAPGESNKAGGVPESNHDMISPITTDTSSLYCLESVSSLISTGHLIKCPSILEKELYLQANMYSQNKNAVAAVNQHTVAMLAASAHTPIGSLDPNSLSGKLRQYSNFQSNLFSIFIYSYTFFLIINFPTTVKAALAAKPHVTSMPTSRICTTLGSLDSEESQVPTHTPRNWIMAFPLSRAESLVLATT